MFGLTVSALRAMSSPSARSTNSLPDPCASPPLRRCSGSTRVRDPAAVAQVDEDSLTWSPPRAAQPESISCSPTRLLGRRHMWVRQSSRQSAEKVRVRDRFVLRTGAWIALAGADDHGRGATERPACVGGPFSERPRSRCRRRRRSPAAPSAAEARARATRRVDREEDVDGRWSRRSRRPRPPSRAAAARARRRSRPPASGAADLLDQPVVAAAAGDRRVGAVERPDELPRRARVVVEPAHERRHERVARRRARRGPRAPGRNARRSRRRGSRRSRRVREELRTCRSFLTSKTRSGLVAQLLARLLVELVAVLVEPRDSRST